MAADGSIVLTTEVDQKGLNTGLNSMKGAVSSASKAFAKLGVAIAAAFSVRKIAEFARESKALYQAQVQAEARLESIMRSRIGATDAEIASVKELTALEQQRGIIGDEIQMAGAQELATYVESTSALKKLIPVMNDMIAQQYGFGASQESAANIATMLGKVLDGQTGALSRYGYFFSEAEEKILKTGNEMERVAVLSGIVEESIGGVNHALAQTDVGRQIQLANAWGDIKEQFGQAFTQLGVLLIPLLQTVSGIMEHLADLALQVSGTFARLFGDESGKKIENNIDNQEKLKEEIKETNKELKGTVASFDEINTISGDISFSENAEEKEKEYQQTKESKEEEAEKWSPWLAARIEELKDSFSGLEKIDTSRISESFGGLKESLSRLAEVAWDRLLNGIDNVIVPLATFTANEILPRFFDALADAADNFAIIWEKNGEVWDAFVEDFLEPVGSFTAQEFLDFWDESKQKVDDFISEFEDTEVFDDLKTIIHVVSKVLVPVFREVVKKLKEIAGFVFGNTLAEAKQKLKDIEDVIGAIAALLRGDFSDAFDHLKDVLLDNKIDKAKEKFENLKKTIKESFEGFKESAAEWKTNISNWWEDDVKPFFDPKKWSETLQVIVDSFADVWNSVYLFFDEKMPEWWDEKIAPWFTSEKWSELFDNAKKGVANGWDKVKGFFTDTIPKWWDEDVTPWFTVEKWKTLGKNILNGLVAPIRAGLNKVIDWVNRINIRVPKILGITDGFEWSPRISRIPELAEGAVIPPNQKFLAVLGDQKRGTNIEAPLETIKQALAEVMSAFVPQDNRPIVISIDGREIARAARSGESALGTQTVFGGFANAL